MLTNNSCDNIVDRAFTYLNKFRKDGEQSFLPAAEHKTLKVSDKDPMELTKLRVGLYELGRKKKQHEVKNKPHEVPEHLKKKKENIDVMDNYAKYINFVGKDGDEKKISGWRDMTLEERKDKLDEFFTVTLCGVTVDEALKKKIYKSVADGGMGTAKDVHYDKVNQRIVALPLVMKFDEDRGCFIEPLVDKAMKKKRDAIKKAKNYFC